MRLECLNRSLANLDSPDTDEIMLLIGEAISCMSRDRSLSLEFDGVNFPHRVSTQRRGRPSFEIKQEQLAFLREQGFKVPTIAQLFCLSTRAIERRILFILVLILLAVVVVFFITVLFPEECQLFLLNFEGRSPATLG